LIFLGKKSGASRSSKIETRSTENYLKQEINELMKKLTLFLVAIFALGLTGCNKDAEVDAFLTEFESTTAEIVKKIDENPSAAGVDAAQKAFAEKKPALQEKFNAIKDARGFQVSEAKQKEMMERVTKSAMSLSEVSQKHAMKLAMDKDAMTKFQNLMKEYGETFKM
jgi:hypothetical protein